MSGSSEHAWLLDEPDIDERVGARRCHAALAAIFTLRMLATP